MQLKDVETKLVVPPGKTINLRRDYATEIKPDDLDKDQYAEQMRLGMEKLSKYQATLYAQNKYSLLVILQAMDAAGKDGTIKHVMSGVNPQGCHVTSFKAPSVEELDHDYLWRCVKALPARGNIGIFNRSYYEDVLVVRVHPELLATQHLDEKQLRPKKEIWKRRFEEINNFEKYLTDNGTVILKFFLHLSKDEQRRRFLERIDKPEKNWKFSYQDVEEREYWANYMKAYEDCFNHTSTEWAPWYVIPADYKPFTRLAVASIISNTLKELKLHYPLVTSAQKKELQKAKLLLSKEMKKK